MWPYKTRSICLILPMVILLSYASSESIQTSKWNEDDINLLEFVPPDYPALARAAVVEGTFNLRAEVGANGRILRINRVSADLNIDKIQAADLFWPHIENELKESWIFSFPVKSSSGASIAIQLGFVLDDTPDRTNCNRTRVEVKLRPFPRLVIHGSRPRPQGGM